MLTSNEYVELLIKKRGSWIYIRTKEPRKTCKEISDLLCILGIQHIVGDGYRIKII